jgi:hypothetical protein
MKINNVDKLIESMTRIIRRHDNRLNFKVYDRYKTADFALELLNQVLSHDNRATEKPDTGCHTSSRYSAGEVRVKENQIIDVLLKTLRLYTKASTISETSPINIDKLDDDVREYIKHQFSFINLNPEKTHYDDDTVMAVHRDLMKVIKRHLPIGPAANTDADIMDKSKSLVMMIHNTTPVLRQKIEDLLNDEYML